MDKITTDDWEWLTAGYLRRLKVPQGWLVESFEDVVHDRGADGRGMVPGWDFRNALAFVPDPEHQWLADVPEPPR